MFIHTRCSRGLVPESLARCKAAGLPSSRGSRRKTTITITYFTSTITITITITASLLVC